MSRSPLRRYGLSLPANVISANNNFVRSSGASDVFIQGLSWAEAEYVPVFSIFFLSHIHKKPFQKRIPASPMIAGILHLHDQPLTEPAVSPLMTCWLRIR